MEVFLFACVLSLGFVAVITMLARWPPGGWAACAASALATFLSGVVVSLALFAQSALTLVWVAVCAARGWKPQTYVAGAAVAAAIGMGTGAAVGIAAMREQARLREDFPIQSLAPRLAYESRLHRPPAALFASGSRHSADVESGLLAIEGRGDRGMRALMLSNLHERTRDGFVLAVGFGNVRMMRARRESIELPDVEPQRLECPTDTYPDGGHEVDNAQNISVDLAAAPAPSDLKAMHFFGLEDLFDSGRMGYVAASQHAAGFESHRFYRVPTLRPAGDTTATWQVVRLELVSLLKYDRPMVYSSAELPRMDALDEMPRREPVEFETAALDRLRQGEDVVFETGGNQIQMLGSLRAAQNCLDCHTALRGELLGALSYELLPAAVAAGGAP